MNNKAKKVTASYLGDLTGEADLDLTGDLDADRSLDLLIIRKRMGEDKMGGLTSI